MKIKITHSTTYKYSSSVPRLIQCLKLYPSVCHNQEILEWETSSSSGKIVESHIDGLGHRVQNIFINNFSGQHRITSKGILKTKDLSGVVRGLKEKVNPLCFLRETHLTKPCKRIEKISNEAKKNNKNLIHEPWKVNFLEEKEYNFKVDKHYLRPIVDNKLRTKIAKEMIWSIRNKPEAREISKQIVSEHASMKR